jgi:hypothetical protein
MNTKERARLARALTGSGQLLGDSLGIARTRPDVDLVLMHAAGRRLAQLAG